MEDTYKGESPSKKYARLSYWLKLSRIFPDRFMREKHLVLASREGGDISVLYSMGVPPKNIIAVDVNREAAAAAQERYPEVKVICKDVGMVAREYRHQIGFALLDFCSHMDNNLLKKIMEVMIHGMKNQGILGFAFLNGREKDLQILGEILEIKKSLDRIKKHGDKIGDQDVVLEYLTAIGQTLSPYRDIADEITDPNNYIDRESMVRYASLIRKMFRECTTSTASMARFEYVRRRLYEEGAIIRCAPIPLLQLVYNSNTKKNKGIPMCILATRVERAISGTPVKKFMRNFQESAIKDPLMVLDCNINDSQLQEYALGYMDEIVNRGFDVESFHLAFNVSRETFSAWKAHRTRRLAENGNRAANETKPRMKLRQLLEKSHEEILIGED